jgi:homocysteine S-methyltransferase
MARDIKLLDGALGTELERRGVDASGKSWTAYANRDCADLVREIHLEYIRAGADIITANTFRTNRRAVGSDAEKLTRRAVGLAREAVAASGKNVQIAGSIAPVEDCFSPELVDPSTARLEAEHEEMALWLCDAGVDIILIETMNSVREVVAAVRAAMRATVHAVSHATSLPIFVSLVPMDRDRLLDGTPIGDAVGALAAAGASLVSLNCAPVSVMRAAMNNFIQAASDSNLAFGCYPNAAEQNVDGSWDLQASDDEAIADLATRWLDAGASLVGSCCGTTPRTTERLRSLISQPTCA